jgi:hypothetical protein
MPSSHCLPSRRTEFLMVFPTFLATMYIIIRPAVVESGGAAPFGRC